MRLPTERGPMRLRDGDVAEAELSEPKFLELMGFLKLVCLLKLADREIGLVEDMGGDYAQRGRRAIPL